MSQVHPRTSVSTGARIPSALSILLERLTTPWENRAPSVPLTVPTGLPPSQHCDLQDSWKPHGIGTVILHVLQKQRTNCHLEPPSSLSPCDVFEYFDSIQGTDEEWNVAEPRYYFDPLDQLADEDYEGLALHLCIDYDMLDALPRATLPLVSWRPFLLRELLGYCERMDTFAFAVCSAVDLRRAEALQPYFGWRPLQVIRKTLEQTTQLAATKQQWPIKRHVQAGSPFSTDLDYMRRLLPTQCSRQILCFWGGG